MSEDKIKAPFSKEQVDKLNAFQSSGRFHPFTCGGTKVGCKREIAYGERQEGKEVEFTPENEGVLLATEEGWVCPCGQYKQDWAWSNMVKEGLSLKQRVSYLQNPNHCPYCNSERIDADPLEIKEAEVTSKVTCIDCGREWIDIYKVSDIEEV